MLDSKKIGSFIKELRTKEGMSQYDLADKIPIDRSVVSKWERGEVIPPVDKIKILCDIFKVTFDEIILGEYKTVENQVEHQNNLFKFLINQDIKYKKLKYSLVIIILVALLTIFSMLIYYFLETHDTQKIYRIYGESDNYQIENGLLVITREKSYLKLGTITKSNDFNYKIHNVKFYYKKDENENLLYEGDSDYILTDLYGYDASLNDVIFDEIKDNLYIRVNGEEIKLKLTKDYRNNNYVLDDWSKYSKGDVSINSDLVIDIDKIKKEFKCDEFLCRKDTKEYVISYDFSSNIIFVRNKVFKISYESKISKFNYDSKSDNFDLVDNKMICNRGICENYKEIYDKYYTNLIKKYLK